MWILIFNCDQGTVTRCRTLLAIIFLQDDVEKNFMALWRNLLAPLILSTHQVCRHSCCNLLTKFTIIGVTDNMFIII